MGLYVLFGALAAFGLLCALWTVLGLWLSGSRGWAVVCFSGQRAALRRCCLLRTWGLFRGPVLAIDPGLTQQEREALTHGLKDIEFCSLQALPERLELERKRVAGTGDADHPGHDQCGGLSKL